MIHNQQQINIGVDEVGRGSLISNAVICASICTNNKISNINDSKKVSPKRRTEIFSKMISSGHVCVISIATLDEIEKYNILEATMRAMSVAIEKMLQFIYNNAEMQISNKYVENQVNTLQTGDAMLFGNKSTLDLEQIRCTRNRNINVLIDGNRMPPIPSQNKMITAKTIIKGDSKIYEISAASIFAKVVRDRFIENVLHPKYSNYEWNQNYGYGTKTHIQQIKKCGITELHRKHFTKHIIPEQNDLL